MAAHHEQLVDVLVEVPIVLDFVQLLDLHVRWAFGCECALFWHLLDIFLLSHRLNYNQYSDLINTSNSCYTSMLLDKRKHFIHSEI